MALEVDRELLVALRLAAERAAVVNERVVVELNERFEFDAELLAIVQQGAVMVRDPPWTRIEIISRREAAILRRPVDFDDLVATANRIVPSAGAVLIFEDLDLVSCLGQFIGRDHPGKACAEHQYRRALTSTSERRWSSEAGIGGVRERRHRLVHRSGAADFANHRQQRAA